MGIDSSVRQAAGVQFVDVESGGMAEVKNQRMA
jgi:hypothetical protein